MAQGKRFTDPRKGKNPMDARLSYWRARRDAMMKRCIRNGMAEAVAKRFAYDNFKREAPPEVVKAYNNQRRLERKAAQDDKA